MVLYEAQEIGSQNAGHHVGGNTTTQPQNTKNKNRFYQKDNETEQHVLGLGFF